VQNGGGRSDEEERKPNQSMLVPADALVPEALSGKLVPVGAGRGAVAKLTYKLSASAFQDGTEMEPADFLYPYALAFRWARARRTGPPSIPASPPPPSYARPPRGVRLVRVEERSLQLADLTFNYRSPSSRLPQQRRSDAEENALVARRGAACLARAGADGGRRRARARAFSAGEAHRRRVPWLDLVRDKAQLDNLPG